MFLGEFTYNFHRIVFAHSNMQNILSKKSVLAKLPWPTKEQTPLLLGQKRKIVVLLEELTHSNTEKKNPVSTDLKTLSSDDWRSKVFSELAIDSEISSDILPIMFNNIYQSY